MIDVPVTVVGSGAAGLMAALSAARFTDALLVTDGPLTRSNSMMAQGGIQVPENTPESIGSMVDDMLRSGRGRADADLVRGFVAAIPPVFERLTEWGLTTDRDETGHPRRRIAGGMSEARVLTSGDQIGVPLMKLLREQLKLSGVECRTHSRVERVLPTEGSVTLELADGGTIRSKRVVIATGGSSYRRAEMTGARTTNPRNTNHTLVERLIVEGARTVDLDLYQFQPFGLVEGPQDPPGRCVPESIVSSGVRLVDRHGAILCPADADRLAVTSAMFDRRDSALSTEHGPAFLLTLDDLEPKWIRVEYPRLHRTLTAMDAIGEPVKVYPFLHYQLGGLWRGPDFQSSLPGIYLAGEIVGGLHGENRLMGNGLTDSLVSGWQAGAAAAAER